MSARLKQLILSSTLLALVSTPVWSEDADSTQVLQQKDVTENTTSESVDNVVKDLTPFLAELPGLVNTDGTFSWVSTDETAHISYPIQDATDSTFELKTSTGPVLIEHDLLSEHNPDTALADLHALMMVCEQNKLVLVDEQHLLFDYSPIAGPRLKSDLYYVIPEGVLTKVETEALDPLPLQDKIAGSVSDLTPLLDDLQDQNKLKPIARQAIDAMLGTVHDMDGAEEFDQFPPSFARRVIRHGWLQESFGTNEATAAIEAAVRQAEQLHTTVHYTDGKGQHLEHVGNVFHNGLWTLRTTTRTVWTASIPEPEFNQRAHSVLSDCYVLLESAPGIDPVAACPDIEQLRSIRLMGPEGLLASWSNEDGFSADEESWRSYFPMQMGGDIAKALFPPHIALANPQGDVAHLITQHGIVTPPKNNSAEDAEQFLKTAAEVLPDAAYLDLFGQYMFIYTYDSPDTAQPLLLGNREFSGDIHQTAWETIATVAGGQCRGDCDDLSEVYHNIATRQGRLPHVISLPGHAACAWAEQHDDGWHMFIMQTGPTYEFIADTLQGALAAGYKHFDENDTFDPNGLGLLLRFSGENTRSSWRLSYRIFSEKKYAATMIDVQRDWHFQTYQRAIHKMLDMIESGDEDTANYRELSGLYNFTGQYELAAKYHEEAITRTPEASSKLFMSLELLDHLSKAGAQERVREVSYDILDTQLPALKETIGGASLNVALQMAGTLAHQGETDLAMKALNQYATDDILNIIKRLVAYCDNDFNKDQWQFSGQIESMRRAARMWTRAALRLLEQSDVDALPHNRRYIKLMRALQSYIDGLVGYDIDDDTDILLRYELIGRYHTLVHGLDAYIEAVAAVDFPTNIRIKHNERVAGFYQARVDARWVKASVSFWWGLITDQLDQRKDTVDTVRIQKLTDNLLAADAFCTEKNMHNHRSLLAAHTGRLVHALVTEDEAALRSILQTVKHDNDKRQRDDTAQWIGDTARVLSDEWFDRVMVIWTEELDYKPKYYWIAWRAALNHATDKALRVAAIAAERFKDDPAFTEEYNFMKKLFVEE